MRQKTFAPKEAERLLPLLRSIGREIRERSRVIDAHEERLAELSNERDLYRDEITRAESELSLQRRELRRVEGELKRLGCGLDADHPLRILVPGRGETFTYEGRFDASRFYRRPIDLGA